MMASELQKRRNDAEWCS